MGLSQAFIFWLMLNSKDYWKKIIIFWTSKKLEQNGHKIFFALFRSSFEADPWEMSFVFDKFERLETDQSLFLLPGSKTGNLVDDN